MTFASLGLIDQLLRTLDTLGYQTPTPVQVQAIPAVLAYNIFGRYINRIEADLEGFARDLRELLIQDTAK